MPEAEETAAMCGCLCVPCSREEVFKRLSVEGAGPDHPVDGEGFPAQVVFLFLPQSFSLCFPPHCVSLCLCICLCHPAGCPPSAEKVKSHLEVPLEENVNRRMLEEGSIEARTIDDAIAVLR